MKNKIKLFFVRVYAWLIGVRVGGCYIYWDNYLNKQHRVTVDSIDYSGYKTEVVVRFSSDYALFAMDIGEFADVCEWIEWGDDIEK